MTLQLPLNGDWSMCSHCLFAIQYRYCSCCIFGMLINRTQMTINFMWFLLVYCRFQCWLYGRIMRKIWFQSLAMHATHIFLGDCTIWKREKKGGDRDTHTHRGRCVSPHAGDGEKHVNWVVQGKLELQHSSNPESHRKNRLVECRLKSASKPHSWTRLQGKLF